VFLPDRFHTGSVATHGFAPTMRRLRVSGLYAFPANSRPLQDGVPGEALGFAVSVFFVVLIPYQFVAELGLVLKFGAFAPQLALLREPVLQTLEKQPGRQLVLVRYSPTHSVHDEWVYNRADIEASQIVWAREMTPEQDRRSFNTSVIAAWLVEADQNPPKLVPYKLAPPGDVAR